ncbi:MAG: RNA polymerase sigma factor [Thiohalomonadales bacterium]
MKTLSLFGSHRKLKNNLEQIRPRLYRMALAWCHKPELADDLVQETMLKALKKSHQLKNDKSLDSWLFSILNNCWRDHFRKQKDTENIDDLVLIDVDDRTPVSQIEQMSVVATVRAAIATLPLGQCQVVTLVDLEDMSYAEVAEKLQIPIGTVMSRLCRARNHLAEKLMEFRTNPQQTKTTLRRVK